MAERIYYVISKDNCQFEGLTKEQVFAAIAEATGNTPTKVDEAFITKIDYDYDADKYLPNLDKDPDWDLVDVSDEQTYYDLIYERRRYVRKKK